MTIGLVLLSALVAIFVNSSKSSRELAKANTMIENGRLAVQLLENDIQHAGRSEEHTSELQSLP